MSRRKREPKPSPWADIAKNPTTPIAGAVLVVGGGAALANKELKATVGKAAGFVKDALAAGLDDAKRKAATMKAEAERIAREAEERQHRRAVELALSTRPVLPDIRVEAPKIDLGGIFRADPQGRVELSLEARVARMTDQELANELGSHQYGRKNLFTEYNDPNAYNIFEAEWSRRRPGESVFDNYGVRNLGGTPAFTARPSTNPFTPDLVTPPAPPIVPQAPRQPGVFDEIKAWVDRAGVQFVRGIPIVTDERAAIELGRFAAQYGKEAVVQGLSSAVGITAGAAEQLLGQPAGSLVKPEEIEAVERGIREGLTYIDPTKPIREGFQAVGDLLRPAVQPASPAGRLWKRLFG